MTDMQSTFGDSNTGTAPVLYLGDSHTAYLKTASTNYLLYPRQVSGCGVNGATAVGMRDPSATTNTVSKFRDEIAGKPGNTIIVVHLGEVDCGSAIWSQAEKHFESIGEQLTQSVDAYFSFIDQLLADGFDRIIITSATLPTITDGEPEAEMIKTRIGASISQSERTALTLAYNQALQAEATRRGLPFVDFSKDILDSQTGVANTAFRNSTSVDHHMDYWRAATVWAANLNPIIDKLDPPSYETRYWVAVSETFGKGLPRHSQDLPAQLKLALQAGDSLTAKSHGELEEYFVVSEGCVNGEPIDSYIRLFHKAHWRAVKPPAEPELQPVGANQDLLEEPLCAPPFEAAEETYYFAEPTSAPEPAPEMEMHQQSYAPPEWANVVPPVEQSRGLAHFFRQIKERLAGKV